MSSECVFYKSERIISEKYCQVVLIRLFLQDQRVSLIRGSIQIPVLAANWTHRCPNDHDRCDQSEFSIAAMGSKRVATKGRTQHFKSHIWLTRKLTVTYDRLRCVPDLNKYQVKCRDGFQAVHHHCNPKRLPHGASMVRKPAAFILIV